MIDFALYPTLAARFWKKVRKTDACWEWTAGKTGRGYGAIIAWDGKRKRTLLAHRVSYELENGAIPDGLCIDHLCRNRGCVRPSHMEPVTLGENVLRGESPVAQMARATTCRLGHPLIHRRSGIGKRYCHECERRRSYAAWLKRRQTA